MLRINRLRVEIETENGMYGIDTKFSDGLNFLASEDNTCGKSSVLEVIYYCLGFEEIIGGRNEKVLTSAYKTFIEDGDRKLSVLESKLYLEISNGEETVTLFRTAKMAHRDAKLITVYYSEMDKIRNKDVLIEDMYVHMPNSAVNIKGFHHFLEKFLHLNLPLVHTSDGNQRKLYLQSLFSCMFIEQKHGWGDIFSGMPFLGIKDAKKRVVEYILNLDTLSNEKKRENLRFEERKITSTWENVIKEIYNEVNRRNCTIIGVPLNPCVINKLDLTGIHLIKDDENLETVIDKLREEYSIIGSIKPKIVDNFEELQSELSDIETDIENMESDLEWLRKSVLQEKASIQVLNDNIEIIESDLRNNKDAARLRDLGSQLGCATSNNLCPVCQQPIKDSLLPSAEGMEIMSIDENIRHLEAQKKMLIYAKESHLQNKQEMDNKIELLMGNIYNLRRLAKTIRNDLYSIDDNVSETIVYKKVDTQEKIEKLNELIGFVEEKKKKLLELSDEWKVYLEDKEKTPTTKFSKLDQEKLKLFRDKFVENLRAYGYKSVIDMGDVDISRETYLPVIEEFDMKFDSSASDNIRGIWAYTVALMYTSMEKSGNHSNVLIFDEPNQHSIVPEDMKRFFSSLITFTERSQTIVGITIKDTDTKNVISNLPSDSYRLITVPNKAFQRMDYLI